MIYRGLFSGRDLLEQVAKLLKTRRDSRTFGPLCKFIRFLPITRAGRHRPWGNATRGDRTYARAVAARFIKARVLSLSLSAL